MNQTNYVPKPFVDHKALCVDNYEDYLKLRQIEHAKKNELKNFLNQ